MNLYDGLSNLHVLMITWVYSHIVIVNYVCGIDDVNEVELIVPAVTFI